MKQRLSLVVGGLLLLAGCVPGLYFGTAITNARLVGIFSTIMTDSPSNRFTAFSCPLLLGRNETGRVVVSITNPAQDNLEYSVGITATGLTVDAPADDQTVSIAGQQTTTLAWTLTAIEAGNQTIVVDAPSNRDQARPGLFHTWPTSFRQACGVFVMDTPLTGAQVMWLSVLSTLAGIALIISWLSGRWRERKAGKVPEHSEQLKQ